MNRNLGSYNIDKAVALEKGSRSKASEILVFLYKYRHLRRYVSSLCNRLEGGVFFSSTLRSIILKYHGVTVGKYSYGPCMIPGELPKGTSVGAYCSFAEGLKIYRRNHPTNTLSQHPFFYNAALGIVPQDTIQLDAENPLKIGNDVWIGSRVTILPSCKNVGNGAVIAAGAVVTKDVQAFSIVAGQPAREIGSRYSSNLVRKLSEVKWWELSLPELLACGIEVDQEITEQDLDMISHVNREDFMATENSTT